MGDENVQRAGVLGKVLAELSSGEVHGPTHPSAAVVDRPARSVTLCVGETMMAVAVEGDEGGASAQLSPAGGESNVAMNLANLGLRAFWAGRVGADHMGDVLVRSVSERGVDSTKVVRDPSHRTGLMVKHIASGGTDVTYYRDNSAASHMSPLDISNLRQLKPDVLHVTGVTPALSAGCDELMSVLVQDRVFGANCLVSLDINYRPRLWSNAATAARRLAELANAADVVFVGQDEASELWGCPEPDQIRIKLPTPRHVVIKDGGRAATEFTRDRGAISAPAPRCTIVDEVGAGDAFAAGWIAGYLSSAEPEQRLSLAHLMAGTALATRSDVGTAPEESELSNAWQVNARWPSSSHHPSAASQS